MLITRHDPNLAISTDVATRPEFAARKKTIQVDGETQTGWFSNDFTLAEIKRLGAISTDAERPQQFNGRFKVPTFQEVIDLAKAQVARDRPHHRIYPETKNPTYFRDLGLPLEDKLIAMLESAGWNSRTAPVFVQSFEPGSLKYMSEQGAEDRSVVQLIDGDGIDLKTGAMTYAVPVDRPYEWTKAGDKRNFDVMVTPAGLAEIKTYADGIGPWKRYIVSTQGTIGADGKPVDINRDGKINDADAVLDCADHAWSATRTRPGCSCTPSPSATSRGGWPRDYKGDPARTNTSFSTGSAWTACSPTSPTPRWLRAPPG